MSILGFVVENHGLGGRCGEGLGNPGLGDK